MPLFKKKKSKKGEGDAQYGSAYLPNGESQQQQSIQGPNGGFEEQPFPSKPFKYAPNLSKTSMNVGGLPINVFGLQELTPASSRALAPSPPELCVAFHMHGRGGSANNEEKIVRQIWDRVERSKRQYSQSRQPQREFLIVSFDARNHGHRTTNQLGQKGWKQDNQAHAIDLYAMILGTSQDVSHLCDFLPCYLFPFDERRIKKFVITGKSLGGHAVWHVLANDSRFQIGIPFISCPDFAKLIAQRAPKSFVSFGPPYVPESLKNLIAQIDPASRSFDIPDPSRNPFWGKQICVCNGREDRLVPWQCTEGFIRRLIVGSPQQQKSNYRIVLEEGIGHEVTESMIEEAGHWIFLHGITI